MRIVRMTWLRRGIAGWLCVTAFGVPCAAAQERVEASEGMIAYESDVPFKSTVGRVESAITSRGLYVMRVFDHARAAAKVGNDLSPNTVVLFGNPEVGSQIMKCAPRAGIDLPQKLQVWEEDGAVLVGYNDPEYLIRRHSIEGCDEVLGRVVSTLDEIARDVASKE